MVEVLVNLVVNSPLIASHTFNLAAQRRLSLQQLLHGPIYAEELLVGLVQNGVSLKLSLTGLSGVIFIVHFDEWVLNFEIVFAIFNFDQPCLVLEFKL